MISAPQEQGEKLIDFLLSFPFVKDKCRKVTFYGDQPNIQCNWSIDIYQFPNIYFELDGVELVLYPKNFFMKEYYVSQETYYYKCRFEFIPYNFFWVFGQSILKEYDMVFDMDKDSVGFWNVERPTEFEPYIIIKIIGYISISIVVGIVIYFIVLYIIKHKKGKENKEEKEKMLSKIEVMQEIASIVPNKEEILS